MHQSERSITLEVMCKNGSHLDTVNISSNLQHRSSFGSRRSAWDVSDVWLTLPGTFSTSHRGLTQPEQGVRDSSVDFASQVVGRCRETICDVWWAKKDAECLAARTATPRDFCSLGHISFGLWSHQRIFYDINKQLPRTSDSTPAKGSTLEQVGNKCASE